MEMFLLILLMIFGAWVVYDMKHNDVFNERNRDTRKDPFKGTNIEGKD